MSEYGLVMPFIDDSESFVLGFECGQIWQRLETGERPVSLTVHYKNIDQLSMMASEHFGISMLVHDAIDGLPEWTTVSFFNARPTKPVMTRVK